jgi:hypothetical protein
MSNVAPIGAVAVEIWTMNSGIVFDNFLATYNAEVRVVASVCVFLELPELQRV